MMQNRQPRGIPAGGEFAQNAHDEAEGSLAPERRGHLPGFPTWADADRQLDWLCDHRASAVIATDDGEEELDFADARVLHTSLRRGDRFEIVSTFQPGPAQTFDDLVRNPDELDYRAALSILAFERREEGGEHLPIGRIQQDLMRGDPTEVRSRARAIASDRAYERAFDRGIEIDPHMERAFEMLWTDEDRDGGPLSAKIARRHLDERREDLREAERKDDRIGVDYAQKHISRIERAIETRGRSSSISVMEARQHARFMRLADERAAEDAE